MGLALLSILSDIFPKKYTVKFLDKHFDVEINKDYDDDYKMVLAETHRSIKSAFWWYEHLSEKPNTGSIKDVIALHNKFITSFAVEANEKKIIPNERIISFLEFVLPDRDDMMYSSYGYDVKNRSDMARLLTNIYNDNKSVKQMSPFLLPQYWIIYNDVFALDFESESGEASPKSWKHIYREWITKLAEQNEKWDDKTKAVLVDKLVGLVERGVK